MEPTVGFIYSTAMLHNIMCRIQTDGVDGIYLQLLHWF